MLKIQKKKYGAHSNSSNNNKDVFTEGLDSSDPEKIVV